MEIVKNIDLSPNDFDRMGLHSFLNILQILSKEICLLKLDLEQPQALLQTSRLTDSILAEVKEGELSPELALRLASVGFFFSREISVALAWLPERRGAGGELRETIGNIRSIIEVLTVRLQEHFERQRVGLNWVAHPVANLTDSFMKFFAAVEKNSKGRYHIRFNVAARGEADYLVNLKIEGPAGAGTLLMPLVMQDVFRDLIANARKYSPPGGTINAGLLQNARELRMVVEDSGCGIGPEEIERVVDFGYRGKGAEGKRSYGGGFGLTKAYVMTRRLGGRMWIESQPGQGTRVSITVPVPRGR